MQYAMLLDWAGGVVPFYGGIDVSSWPSEQERPRRLGSEEKRTLGLNDGWRRRWGRGGSTWHFSLSHSSFHL